ncbi:MAG: ABC transporter substrate-binding protein [Solirubrobacteraceae bacterium]|nr:ABC transporter substrate-binding protein [Solirubrobacteraceae bacterium]
MITLKRLAALMAAVLLAVAFAACGGDDSDSSTGGANSGPAAAETGSFPVTVEHKYGSTTIDAAPERVVALGYTDQDPVLAVGVVPVGVGDFLGGYDWRKRPWAQDALKGAVPKVVGGQEINFEAVAAARPNLIFAINAGLKKADYERLSKIAPTVAQSGDYIDFGMPWDEQQALVGKALGRDAQAKKAIDDVKAKFAKVAEENPTFKGASAILGYGGPDGYGAYATQDTRSRFLTDLGFEVPKEIDALAKDAFYAQFSQEQFRLLDQDLVLMYGDEDEITKNAVVGRLDAVKEGRIVYLPVAGEFAAALGFASTLSLTWILDNQVETLAAAADGDPATKVTQPE